MSDAGRIELSEAAVFNNATIRNTVYRGTANVVTAALQAGIVPVRGLEG